MEAMAIENLRVSMRAVVASIRHGEFENKDIHWEGQIKWISAERVWTSKRRFRNECTLEQFVLLLGSDTRRLALFHHVD